MIYQVLWHTICCLQNQVHHGKVPLLFTIKALGSFTCITQHYGVTSHLMEAAIMSCFRTPVSWLGLEPTLCWSGTPELQLSILIRYATTHHYKFLYTPVCLWKNIVFIKTCQFTCRNSGAWSLISTICTLTTVNLSWLVSYVLANTRSCGRKIQQSSIF